MEFTAVAPDGRVARVQSETLLQNHPRSTVNTSTLLELMMVLEELPGKYFKVLSPLVNGMLADAVIQAAESQEQATSTSAPVPSDPED